MTSVSILPALEAPVGYEFTGIKAVPLPGLNSVAWLLKRHLLTSKSGAAFGQVIAQCGVTSPGSFQAVAGGSWAALTLDIWPGQQTRASRALLGS